MNKELKKILDDLYELDSGFKEHEKDLIKILEKLMESKPDIKIDKQFLSGLRRQLMAKTEDMNETSSDLESNFFIMLKKWIAPFAGGAVVTALILIAVFYNNPAFNPTNPVMKSEDKTLTTSTSDTSGSVATTLGVTKLKDNAFGNLSELSAGNGQAESGATFGVGSATEAAPVVTATVESVAVGRGGGGVAVSSDEAVSSKILPPYTPKYYKYVYKGSALDLTDKKVTVYRRKDVSVNDKSLISAAKSMGFGAIDLTGFSGLSAQNISLTQNQKNGYVLNINVRDQSVNLYKNWSYWEDVYQKCKNDRKCYENLRLKPSDVPSDSDIQTISDKFLKSLKVDLTKYGAPEVRRYWEEQYGEGATGQVYIPDEIQIIYPVYLDNKSAMDESGYPSGLNVSVNIRQKKVSGINNLKPSNFESSDYDAVTDMKDMLEYASTRGWSAPDTSKAEIIEVELGDPKEVLATFWRPSTDGTSHTEYYAPALRFPIINKPDKYFYQKYVIVPLAKDLLKRSNSSYPEPMPLMRAEPVVDAVAPAVEE